MFPFFVLVCARCSLTNDSMTQQGVCCLMHDTSAKVD